MAVGAGEAVAMEGMGLVGDSTLVDNTIALETTLSKCVFITRNADILVLPRDKALVSNRLFAHGTTETFFMPLLSAEFKLLHSSSEDVSTSVASRSKVVIMTIRAVQTLLLAGEGLIHQGVLTVAALEAHLMPMLLFVGQVLGIRSNGFLALLAGVGKQVLIALDAEGVLLAQDVSVPGETQVAVPAGEVRGVEVLLHRAVFTGKY